MIFNYRYLSVRTALQYFRNNSLYYTILLYLSILNFYSTLNSYLCNRIVSESVTNITRSHDRFSRCHQRASMTAVTDLTRRELDQTGQGQLRFAWTYTFTHLHTNTLYIILLSVFIVVIHTFTPIHWSVASMLVTIRYWSI